MDREIINDHEFEHLTANGTWFRCDRCDLAVPVKVTHREGLPLERLMADFVEFAAFHVRHIHPKLNGFAGYDAIEYEISHA